MKKILKVCGLGFGKHSIKLKNCSDFNSILEFGVDPWGLASFWYLSNSEVERGFGFDLYVLKTGEDIPTDISPIITPSNHIATIVDDEFVLHLFSSNHHNIFTGVNKDSTEESDDDKIE